MLVGPATKFVERLHTATKVYAAIVRFGTETETDDRGAQVGTEVDSRLARQDKAPS